MIPPGQIILVIALLFLLAVFIDWQLMRWLASRWQRNCTRESRGRGVYLFGRFSPILTWLKYHRSEPPPARKQTHQRATAQFDLRRPEERSLASFPTRRATLSEWSLIALVLILFFGPILFNGESRLPGSETQAFQSLDWTFYHSVFDDHTFPLWNPYLLTGLPYLADPTSHTLNPLVGIPVLLFGPQNGLKTGVFLTFLAAAWGMWYLASVLGMGRAARLWAALAFALAGQPLARFMQGQYLLVLGFAWIPWIVGGMFHLARTRRLVNVIGTGFALAFLFLAGGPYHILFILLVIVILALVMPLHVQRTKPYLTVDTDLFKWMGLALALALGLAAVQLLPQSTLWPDLQPASVPAGMQTLRQIFLSYISKNIARPDIFESYPAPEEFYAYIGPVPFAALIFLPLAVWKRERKPIIVATSILLLVGIWVSPGILHNALEGLSIFIRFPFLLRILVYGSFAIVLLAALGIDTAFKLLPQVNEDLLKKHEGGGNLRAIFGSIGAGILVILMSANIIDLFRTNRAFLTPSLPDYPARRAVAWLGEHDPSAYYVSFEPHNATHDAVISAQSHFLDAWYFFDYAPSLDGAINQIYVKARPHYVISPAQFPPPSQADAQFVNQVEGYNIYKLANSLPYAFTVPLQTLTAPPAPQLTSAYAAAACSYRATPNRIEVTAHGNADQMLVVLTTSHPEWHAAVDGEQVEIQNVGGYLAVPLRDGSHTYTFSYRPKAFFIGLLISTLCFAWAVYVLGKNYAQRPWDIRLWLDHTHTAIRGLVLRLRPPRPADKRFDLEGIYRKKTIRIASPLEVADGTPIHVAADTLPAASPLRAATIRWLWSTGDLVVAIGKAVSLEAVFFTIAISVYAFTRLYALESFPIYFFSDEAVQTLFAQALIKSGFVGTDGTFIPMYVEVEGLRWTPMLPIYIHALTLTLFGKSILVTRATSAVVGILAPLAAALTLKKVFKARLWWTVVFFLAVTPAWFIHSRTAFETALATAFYACFLLTYLLYRTQSPKYIYAALAFGAATFYSYSNAQAIIAFATAMLFIVDFRYHWQHKVILARGLLLALVLAYPLISFEIHKPSAMGDHLRVINSYWLQPIPLTEKISLFIHKYSYGLSPAYWFFPNNQDFPRHRMAGLGQMQTAVLPLFLIGLIISLAKIKSVPHRTVLIAALATPIGASVVDVGITRVLAFVVPANILVVLGLEWAFKWIKNQRVYQRIGALLFVGLIAASLALMHYALVQGPLWFNDYGLYGMQWGARQLFEEAIPPILAKEPNTQILVSSSWANGTEKYLDFFFGPADHPRIRMDGIETYLFRQQTLTPHMLFVMTPFEFQKAAQSQKVNIVSLEKIIPYPDGQPGFYFARLAYTPHAAAIFAAEKEARSIPVQQTFEINGETIHFTYSKTDMGAIPYLFDQDDFTLIRGLEANPFKLEMDFSRPRTLDGLEISFGMANIDITAYLYETPNSKPVVYTTSFLKDKGEKLAKLSFDNAPRTVSRLSLEFFDPYSGETANIHIREIHFLP